MWTGGGGSGRQGAGKWKPPQKTGCPFVSCWCGASAVGASPASTLVSSIPDTAPLPPDLSSYLDRISRQSLPRTDKIAVSPRHFTVSEHSSLPSSINTLHPACRATNPGRCSLSCPYSSEVQSAARCSILRGFSTSTSYPPQQTLARRFLVPISSDSMIRDGYR